MKILIKTYGCQMNVNDSEKMAGLLISDRHEIIDDENEAEVFIVNTCSVREKAKEKLFSYIGRLKNLKQNPKIIVTGCVPQLIKSEIKKRAPYVDILIGTDSFHKIAKVIKKLDYEDYSFHNKWIEISDKNIKRNNDFSAYVTIMKGCNHFCSYCVVPYARGRERFRPESYILKEIHNLEKKNFKEIQLLGQNVDTYRGPETGIDFSELLRLVAENTKIPWIRFLTSHPAKFSIKIAEVIKDYKSILRAIHLPFQAGSDKILKLMNRGYDQNYYLKLVDNIKKILPDVALSTDVIVGFPGENKQDFLQTIKILKYVEFENIFSFKYSPRPGTKAFSMKENIGDSEKTIRLIEIQNLQKSIQLKNNERRVGKIFKVLTEKINKKNKNQLVGRIYSGRVVNIEGAEQIGEFYDVKIKECGPHNLKGEVAR